MGAEVILPEYFFSHCLHENQVDLPEYYLIFCPKMAICKIGGGGGGAAAPSAPWSVCLCLHAVGVFDKV